MKIRWFALFLILAAASHAETSSASAGARPAAGRTGIPGETGKKEIAAAKPAIRLGMAPEEVVKVIGRADKTEPVETPAGKGEQWTYRRLERQWTQQTAAVVDMVPAFVGLAMPNDGLGETAVPMQKMETVRVYQVSSLLFIEGKLAAAKQWPEKETQIDN